MSTYFTTQLNQNSFTFIIFILPAGAIETHVTVELARSDKTPTISPLYNPTRPPILSDDFPC